MVIVAPKVDHDGDVYRQTYFSLDDFADAAVRHHGNGSPAERGDMAFSMDSESWSLGVKSVADAAELARTGWQDGLTDAMPLADKALQTIESEIETLEFNALWDVSGGEVDIDRYIQGVPENMIEYETVPVSSVGKVVTLCASGCYSGALSAKNVLRRGAAIVGLALALEKSGHACELWLDMSTGRRDRMGHRIETRVLVKGAHDTVDPARIAFAYAHPAMLRKLAFGDWLAAPQATKRAVNIPGSFGCPVAPKQDLPDGTIYLPELRTADDVEEPEAFILDTLDKLGLRQETGR